MKGLDPTQIGANQRGRKINPEAGEIIIGFSSNPTSPSALKNGFTTAALRVKIGSDWSKILGLTVIRPISLAAADSGKRGFWQSRVPLVLAKPS